jgi:Anti-sigma-K factor rskA, C-terminal
VTHEELREHLEAWAIGALRAPEAQEVERHLLTCQACSEVARGLSLVPLALEAHRPVETPSPFARTRLLSMIQGSASAKATADKAEGAFGTTASAERLPAGASAQSERISGASIAAWLAVAAALVLAAFLGWDGVRLRGRIAELTTELAQARAAVAATESRMAMLQRSADRNQSALAVLTAPDVARIDLAGQPDAPQASGRAYWSRARGMVFSAAALPPPPSGRTYQVWVVTSAPAPISAGLIEPDSGGHVSAVFATPPDIPQPIAVAVTLEPAGGVPAPTGPKVLVGTV